MRQRAYRWAFWAAAIAVVLVINAIDVWSAKDVRDWVFGQTGAAWVQAVGSVAAIVFGFWYSEHRLAAGASESRARGRRALASVGTELLNYLNRELNFARSKPRRPPRVDAKVQEGWWKDLRSLDIAVLDRYDRGRYWTLRHHLLTMGNRLSDPLTNPMTVEELSEMSNHIWTNVVRPLADAGAFDE